MLDHIFRQKTVDHQVVIISIASKMVLANTFTVGMVYAFMAYKQHFSERIAALIDKLIAFKMLSIHL
jgi:ATP-binding cassette subfamily B protein RaxB